ncbi:VOC family protein [Actinoplanes solisilvae]|uniref:VOC family protein n=1 Tax=Actinoplanes solisilvae TaxID=2486853 RepID=UPI000FD7829B|nr:VOC family protein [Actinoplanes solisilvae]
MVDFRIEVVVLPVSDVERAREFYNRAGFKEQADHKGPGGFRIVHFTPPGSPTSIIIGSGITEEAPGTSQSVLLVVDDLDVARKELVGRGIEVSEVFHDAGGVFHHAGTTDRVPGFAPGRRSYSSFASFTDPDGNLFVLQEVTERHPGRITQVVYRTVGDLEQALREAAETHGEPSGADWPARYGAYLAEAAGVNG